MRTGTSPKPRWAARRRAAPELAAPEPGLRPLAVVAPLEQEIAPLRRRLRGRSRLSLPSAVRAWRGRLGDVEIIAAVVGDGPVAATAGLGALLDGEEVAGVLVIGVAGGLDPDLDPGEVVGCRTVLEGDRPLPPPDQDRLARSLSLPGLTSGVAVQAPRIVAAVAAKRRLFAAVAAQGAVVDLESAALARVAIERGAPYQVLRSVCDGADEALPDILVRSQRENGGVDRRKVALHALSRPRLALQLLGLGRRVARAADRLAGLTQAVAAHW